ncbi:hypothetical protein D3C81_1703860 [compost metagenome]
MLEYLPNFGRALPAASSAHSQQGFHYKTFRLFRHLLFRAKHTPPYHFLRDREPGIFHQDGSRNSNLLYRLVIQLPHLTGINKPHTHKPPRCLQVILSDHFFLYSILPNWTRNNFLST